MKIIRISTIISVTLLSLTIFADEDGYKKLRPECRSCNAIEDLLVKHDRETSPDKRLILTLNIADTIKKISLKGKSNVEQRREIYFAINGSIQVLRDDFDSETCVRLLDLRGTSPQNFDYVFWRFPIAQQKDLIARMQAFKDDKIRPNAKIPTAKAID